MRLPCLVLTRIMEDGERYKPNSCFIQDDIRKRELLSLRCTKSGLVKVYYHPWDGMIIKNAVGLWLNDDGYTYLE